MEINAPILRGLLEQTRARFSTHASVLRPMRAIVESIDPGAKVA